LTQESRLSARLRYSARSWNEGTESSQIYRRAGGSIMYKPSYSLAAVLMLMLPASVWAQSAQRSSTAVDKPARQVVASTSGNSIRFSSLGELMQVRLEVIGPAGDLLLDTDFKQGNLIDWPALDKQGQRLADGPYLCIITVKDSSGELTRRQAIAV